MTSKVEGGRVRLIPFDSFSLTCSDPPDLLAARMSGMLKPSNYQLAAPINTLFGQREGGRFKATLAPIWAHGPKGASFFRPVIVGEVLGTNQGSEIRIHLRPAWSDAGIGGFQVGFLGLYAVAALFRSPLWTGASDGGSNALRFGVSLAAFGLAAFFYVSFLRKFWAGTTAARAALNTWLRG